VTFDPPTPQADDGAWFRRGVLDGFGPHLVSLGITFVGIGALAHDLGFPYWSVILSTVLINAGPAQVIFFGALGSGAALFATVVAVSLSSIRFVPMVVSIVPLIRTERTGLPALLFASHFVAVTNWVEGLRRLPPLPRGARLPFFVGFGLTVMGACIVGNTVGYVLASGLPTPLAAALLFMTPIYFTAAVCRAIKARGEWVAMILGFVLTPMGVAIGMDGFELAVAGLVGGGAGYLLDRRDRRARSAA
jgi:predicted branched-subunit amino acid permease